MRLPMLMACVFLFLTSFVFLGAGLYLDVVVHSPMKTAGFYAGWFVSMVVAVGVAEHTPEKR